MEEKKVAIVYDWLDKWGGVERVLLTFLEIFPKAVLFTSYFDEKKAPWAKNFLIKTSFIQKIPSFIKKNRLLSLPFYPLAFETFDFSDFDLVISVTSSFAKGVIVKTPVKHIVYLLTPTRFLWIMPQNYHLFGLKKFLVSPYLNYLRKWDYACAQRADKIISISKTVQKRCLKYYQRESEVIYPPFDIEYWKNIKNQISPSDLEDKMTNQNSKLKEIKEPFFLLVSRLESYKKVDLVVKVFNKRKEKLIIVGDGTEEKKLKKMAAKNIIFLKKLTDKELAYFYSHALALIMPQEEDFGYVSLEAQFFGTPVLAYKKGGAFETVISYKTGLFFEEQNEESLNRVINKFLLIEKKLKYQTRVNSLKNLKKFDKINFVDKFKKII
jgi:glycosyltransferase involved in cell wall biosynthesis